MWPFNKRHVKLPKFTFFGQLPNRDASLDSIRDGVCPDCGRTHFKIKICALTYLTCKACGAEFVISPVCILRTKRKGAEAPSQKVEGF